MSDSISNNGFGHETSSLIKTKDIATSDTEASAQDVLEQDIQEILEDPGVPVNDELTGAATEEDKADEAASKTRMLSKEELQSKRTAYYGAKKRVTTLEAKIGELEKIIKSGKLTRIKKATDSDEEEKIIVRLTAPQIKDLRAKLELYKYELMVAKDNLKLTTYDFTVGTRHNVDAAKNKAKAYMDRKNKQTIERITLTINSVPVADIVSLKEAAKENNFVKLGHAILRLMRKSDKSGKPIFGVNAEVSKAIALRIL